MMRDDFREDSDVDVLYEFEDGKTIGWGIVTIADELSAIIGHRVDFTSNKYFSRYIRRHPSFKPEVIYGEG